MLPFILAAALAGCSNETLVVGSAHPTPDSRRVLVVYNGSSEDSREVAEYYAMRRRIPASNIVRIDCTSDEEISEGDFHRAIEGPVQANLRKNPNQIDFIVLTKGIPIRLSDDEHYSVDAWLAAGDLPITPIVELTRDSLMKSLNPYFGAAEPFSSKKFGFHLVTRLDGYTVSDCKALVDHSLEAKPEKGPFLLDEADNRKSGNYLPIQKGLERAAKVLTTKGFEVDFDQTKEFVAPAEPVAGYASWGSNDAAYDLETYRKIRFKPGALCETFVSTSGRTFRPTRGGQSLIADLIADGVTGVKGYVSEPYTFALAKPDLLFDRYTGGLNLAESFYAASQFLKWKDVVIGDPLCDPYRR
ncbi:MAG TPA: TIGR03790 family protein [Fimbriimonadaceae bacterium]|nr:TIGR03790 family protein [Fimbriimonadaceae bacterium]